MSVRWPGTLVSKTDERKRVVGSRKSWSPTPSLRKPSQGQSTAPSTCAPPPRRQVRLLSTCHLYHKHEGGSVTLRGSTCKVAMASQSQDHSQQWDCVKGHSPLLAILDLSSHVIWTLPHRYNSSPNFSFCEHFFLSVMYTHTATKAEWAFAISNSHLGNFKTKTLRIVSPFLPRANSKSPQI